MKTGERNGLISLSPELMQLKKMREEERQEREGIVLWKRPFTTLQYFTVELCLTIQEYAQKLWAYKLSVLFTISLMVLSVIAYHIPGPHQELIISVEKQVIWCLYWLGLGVLSSVGLGTGLHTFLLYLGPHIAAVTLAAYECGTLDFPSPPYPDSIICPENETLSQLPVTLWSIMAKVRLEAMMWGAGTALGELPPYFMARAARLSTLGNKGKRGRRRSSIELNDDIEKLIEFETLQLKQQHPEQMTLLDRLKSGVERLVERVGFFGILACASIPNPLFDLAGITCGHFLVPFWTFFGATLIGKAIIKTHLQQLTVIVAFNENLVNKLLTSLANVPVIGSRLKEPIEQLFRSQKAKLHAKEGTIPSEGGSLLASLFEKLVMVMVIYFVISIVNSLAQSYHHRLQTRKQSLTAATPRQANKNRSKSQTIIAKQA
ncbi:vacuole membrane protein 1-like [Daphnia magna]|uniref:vacuole membrane protein 1-like n=1 Tax=Daphnia magna TaxID=35525 RepID=UPI001401F773|nr:vacuole membrane protein 1-like [Daphnia magna]XP_045033266.1 vacuole membrane protein 1-like [Daphnia magna]